MAWRSYILGKFLMNNSWWLDENTNPLVYYDDKSAWTVSVNEHRMSINSIRKAGYFPFPLNIQQVKIVVDLMHNNNFISGHYETWDEFVKAHKISSSQSSHICRCGDHFYDNHPSGLCPLCRD